jgi:hypothetical protein
LSVLNLFQSGPPLIEALPKTVVRMCSNFSSKETLRSVSSRFSHLLDRHPQRGLFRKGETGTGDRPATGERPCDSCESWRGYGAKFRMRTDMVPLKVENLARRIFPGRALHSRIGNLRPRVRGPFSMRTVSVPGGAWGSGGKSPR